MTNTIISRKRPGSMKYQVITVLRESGIFKPGSKHAHKVKGGALFTKQPQSKFLHYDKTVTKYLNYWIKWAEFAKENYGIKYIRDIKPLHSQNFTAKLFLDEIGRDNLKQSKSALAKFQTAMKMYFKDDSIDITTGVNTSQYTSKMPPSKGHRPFKEPEVFVANLQNPDCRMIAENILHFNGSRIGVFYEIKPEQLRGKNKIEVIAKGGQKLEFPISPELYERVQNAGFLMSSKTWYADVKKARENIKDQGTGAHSLRKNFAIRKYIEFARIPGVNDHEAKLMVSELLGHHRVDYTIEHYLDF